MCSILLCACSSTHEVADRNPSRTAHAGSVADAAAADGVADAHTALAALLMERDRAAELSCPCSVEAGTFESLDTCVARLGYKHELIECLSTAIEPFDSPELREQLACEATISKERNQCLEAASCAEVTTTACNEHANDCPMVDPQILTQVLGACPGAFVLGRP